MPPPPPPPPRPRVIDGQVDFTQAISKALGSFIESKSATFACGGSIPVLGPEVADTTSATSASVSTLPTPLTIRWDTKEDSAHGSSKLTFPLSADELESNSLARLVADCEPASFGHNGQDVLDDTYRKATKMDRTDFSIDFCPYEVGIVDTIAQLLLPGTSHSTHGVRAELYKLNVYAAPSGFFKPHVDTPRSSSQFGSLVVSLPCVHRGGALVVRHANFSKTFSWGADTTDSRSSPRVHWAAFYSDCEHEVKEVTEGHRVTLTYNLYHTPGVGELAGKKTAMDVETLPLFLYVREALKTPTFMPQGGNLGIYCQHYYAHTDSDLAQRFPGILKGSDMAVYDVFRALGLELGIHAILQNVRDDDDSEYYDSDDDENPYRERERQENTVVGRIGGLNFSELGGSEENRREIIQGWGGKHVDVTWVNDGRYSSIDMVHMTYGNQAGIGALYSSAAIIVKVPSTVQRSGCGTRSEPICVD